MQERAGDIPTDRRTDEELVAALCAGQTAALDELYARYARRLYVFCYHTMRAGRPQDAEDLVQDVFVRVIKAAHTYKPQRASFRTWLFQIARNCCIDAIRRKQKINTVSVEGTGQEGDARALLDTLVDPDQNVEGAAIRTATIQAVRDCIAQLDNEIERQAILLYYVANKVYREIGAVLGKSTSMARNRVKSAQTKVKACLESKRVL